MRRFLKVFSYSLLLISILIGTSLYLSDVTFSNRVFTVVPQIYQAKSETLVAGNEVAVSSIPWHIKGRITDTADVALAGAMISIYGADSTYRRTSFSDKDGNYILDTEHQASLEVRVRAHDFEDQILKLELAHQAVEFLNFRLSPLATTQARSDQLPASAHAALLDWPDEKMRDVFISQCHFCHQIGNEFTRSERELETWTDIVDRMEGYLVMLTNAQKNTIRDTLAKTFNGKPITSANNTNPSREIAEAVIEEWQVGDGQSFIHDSDIGHDGRLFGVDEGHDLIWIVDRKSGKTERVALPPSELPIGGNFSGLAMPVGIFTGKHGPHSLAQSSDGRFWITNALSSTLMAFEPKTNRIEVFPIGGDALYPHTIRVDNNDTIWFTLAASNQVARFQPQTGTFTIIGLPSNGFAQWLTDLFLPLILKTAALLPRSNLHLSLSHHKWFGLGKDAMAMPYGIDVNPMDGSIWYAKLNANRIGRIDPETLKIAEYMTPLGGPRRPRFGADGRLWIPSFEDSALMAFDPATEKFRTHKLPAFASGQYETPYALNVSPDSGDIWVTSNQSDRVFKFDPNTERFYTYPLPTRVSFLRDLVFTEDGKICSSQSNLPAYAIEGGRPAFICIDPDGKK